MLIVKIIYTDKVVEYKFLEGQSEGLKLDNNPEVLVITCADFGKGNVWNVETHADDSPEKMLSQAIAMQRVILSSSRPEVSFFAADDVCIEACIVT